MTGIAGVFNYNKRDIKALIERMCRTLCYSSSPIHDIWTSDDSGVCSVHNELCNIGEQPVFNEAGTLCIVVSGEPSFLDAATQSQHCNASHCLNLFETEGESAFLQLNGSFCLCILDLTGRQMWLVSDRFSSRPLFYAQLSAGALVFGTQINSIFEIPEVPRTLNPSAVLDLFSFQRVLGEKTLHSAIRMLPPGHVLHASNGRISSRPYWQMNYRPDVGSFQEFSDQLADTVSHSLQRITGDSNRLGVLLSGGLDSRMILSAIDKPITCFTFGDYRNNEYECAKRVADAKGAKLHFIQRGANHYSALLDSAVTISNGMYSFIHAHAIGFLEEISEQVDILLHGFVPELYFRGTNFPHAKNRLTGRDAILQINQNTCEDVLIGIMAKGLKYSLVDRKPQQLFSSNYNAIWRDSIFASLKEMVQEASSHTSDVYDKVIWPDTYWHAKYPSFLFESTLRPYVNERSFVFDNEILDLHLRIPSHLRSNSKLWVSAVKKLNPKIASLTDANTGLSPRLPSWLIESYLATGKGIRDARQQLGRMPFFWRLSDAFRRSLPKSLPPGGSNYSWPDYPSLIRQDLVLQRAIAATIADEESIDPSIFSTSRVAQMLSEHLACKRDHSGFLLLLLTFGRWHKRYVANNTTN